MWAWLTAILKGIVSAVLEWWQGQADKPNTLEDAKTPKTVKAGFDAYVAGDLERQRLRDEKSDNSRK